MSHHISFKAAFDGLKYALFTQPNFRIHLVATALALSLAWLFKISQSELLILLFTITLVAEMINTSIEAMTDLLSPTHHPQAKIAKDVAAGMVLLTASLSIIIGLAIFLPKF